jgi:hypothetical protein
MSHVYTPDGTNFPADVTVPDGSDLKNLSNLLNTIEGVWDRTEYLSRYAQAQINPVSLDLSNLVLKTDWDYVVSLGSANGPGYAGRLQVSVASSGGQMLFEVTNLIQYYLVDTIIASVIGSITGGAHGANLPANMPKMRLYKWADARDTTAGWYVLADGTTGTTGLDISGTAAAYDLDHLIVISGLTTQIDHPGNYDRYFIEIIGEYGANSVASELLLKALIIS